MDIVIVVLYTKRYTMRLFDTVSYDPQANACYITLHNDRTVVDTIVRDDVILDLDSTGDIVGIEILNVNKHHAIVNKLLLSQEPISACVSY